MRFIIAILLLITSCAKYQEKESIVGNWQFLDSSAIDDSYHELYINSETMRFYNWSLGEMFLPFEYEVKNDSIWIMSDSGYLKPYAYFEKNGDKKMILYIENKQLELDKISDSQLSPIEGNAHREDFIKRMESYYVDHGLITREQLKINKKEAEKSRIEIEEKILPIKK